MLVAFFRIPVLQFFYSVFVTFEETEKLPCQKLIFKQFQCYTQSIYSMYWQISVLVLSKWSFAVAVSFVPWFFRFS